MFFVPNRSQKEALAQDMDVAKLLWRGLAPFRSRAETRQQFDLRDSAFQLELASANANQECFVAAGQGNKSANPRDGICADQY